MGTISAKKISDALSKAKDVGAVEEPLTIDDTTIVLRNLRPDQFIAIYDENKEREGIDAMFAFQKSHICRSIVEINGVDLRDVDFVEVEEEVKDPKTGDPVLDQQGQPKIKKVKLERHEYVRQHVLNSWSKEPVGVAFRKFNDVLKLAEDKAKSKVQFVLPDMTPEEKFRESIGNVREIIDEVPEALADSILEEAGLMRISRADEIKRAQEVMDNLARDQEAAAKAQQEAQEAQVSQQAAPPPQTPQAAPAGPPVDPARPRVRQASPEEIMARRSPLNRQSVEVPNPNPQPTIATPQTAHQAPPQPPPQVSGAEALQAVQRSQQIARLEQASLDMEVPLAPPGDPNMTPRHVVPGQAATGQALPNAPHLQRGTPPEAPVLAHKGREQVDMKAFDKIVEKPPMAGINPRFRAPR